jgi:hypothetical protein
MNYNYQKTQNYKKAKQIIVAAGVVYEKVIDELKPGFLAEERKESKWFDQVTNPQKDNAFIQWADLKQVGIEPPDELTAKRKYPIKGVSSISRLQRISDLKEFILSRQFWIGLDRNGNEVGKSMEDEESWIKPIVRYEQKPENPSDRFSKIIRKAVGFAGEMKILQQPYDVKYLDELYSMPDAPGTQGTKQLVIQRIGDNGEKVGPAYAMPKYEDFRNRPFDELWEYAITPRTQDQTKIGHEETRDKNKQYG